MRKAVVASLLFAVATAGCVGQDVTGAPDDIGDDWAQQPRSTSYKPVAVPGLDSCMELPTTPPQTNPNGERLPDLKLPCLVAGPDINLARLGGRPTIVNLWATWCGPCREEMPILQDAHETYGDKVQFLGVVTRDSPELAATFLQEVGVTYPQVVDPEAELLVKHLRVPGLPVTVVLDSRGRVTSRHVGPFDEEALDDLVRDMIRG